jgi:hypothetical protein
MALATMLFEGLARPRCDLVISASSPPCLLVAATLIAARHRAKSVHWIMDLYPEIAVALGEIRSGPLVSGIEHLMSLCYRRTSRVVVLDGDMASQMRRYDITAEIVRPWVFEKFLASPPPVVSPADPWTWIYSGNLGRAHEWETLLEAQRLVESRSPDIRLLFRGGGPSWRLAQAKAEQIGLRRCDWQPYVREEDLYASLLRCHCCIVTQLPAAKGLLWPSKLGLVLTLPRPILWVGPIDGAIAQELRELPHAGVFPPGAASEIADWVLARRSNPTPVHHTFDAQADRQTSLAKWARLIVELL